MLPTDREVFGVTTINLALGATWDNWRLRPARQLLAPLACRIMVGSLAPPARPWSLAEEKIPMTGRAKCLITVGRWVVVLTHVLVCANLVVFALMAAYSVATGKDRLRLDEPWESILFYGLFAIWFAILPCWGVFCLAFAVVLRRHRKAGSLRQMATILRVSVPFWGLGYYDCIIRGLTDGYEDLDALPNHCGDPRRVLEARCLPPGSGQRGQRGGAAR